MVTIYTRDSCGPCKTVKYFLDKKGVEYTELNVDENPSLMDEIIAKTGFQMVPTVEINGNYIQGLNLALLSKQLML